MFKGIHKGLKIKHILLGIFAFLQWQTAQAQSEGALMVQGGERYKAGDYASAAKNYASVAAKNPASAVGYYNLGNSLYRQANFVDAAANYEKAAALASDKTLKADAFHNLGNAHLQNQSYKEAVEAYKNALRLRPNDFDSKNNLAFALRQIAAQEQQAKINQTKANGEKVDEKDNPDPNNPEKDKDNPDKNNVENPRPAEPKNNTEKLMELVEREALQQPQPAKKNEGAGTKKPANGKDW